MVTPRKPSRRRNSIKHQDSVDVSSLDSFAKLRTQYWGVSQKQAQELMRVLIGIVTSQTSGNFDKINAFKAVLEARKIDMAALKLLIEKEALEKLTDNAVRSDLINIDSLDLEDSLTLLEKIRTGKENPLRIARTG